MRVARLPLESQTDLRRDRPHSLPTMNRSRRPKVHKTHTHNDCQASRGNEDDTDNYSNTYEDRDSAPKIASVQEQQNHKKIIKQLGDKIFEPFKAVNNEGKKL